MRQQFIRRARFRTSARVVVRKHDRGGVEVQRAAHDLAGIDARVRQRAGGHAFRLYRPVLRVQPYGPELFDVETIQAEAQVIGHDGRAVEWFALRVVERAAFENPRCACYGAVLAFAAGKIGGHGLTSSVSRSTARASESARSALSIR